MDLGLAGKVVAVTGAGGGIGGRLVAAFAAEGATVLGTDLHQRDEVPPGCAAWCAADLTAVDGAATVVAAATGELGRLDVVVNCAGISEPATLDGTTDASWARVLDVNLTACWRLCREAMPALRTHAGNVVNIASFAGKRGTLFGDNASYTVSKAGVIGLTHALALECAPAGVRVNAVAPGPVDTPMLRSLPAGKRDRLTGMVPLGRLPTPEDVAAGVLFLASSQARNVTGEVMDINGGLYLD